MNSSPPLEQQLEFLAEFQTPLQPLFSSWNGMTGMSRAC